MHDAIWGMSIFHFPSLVLAVKLKLTGTKFKNHTKSIVPPIAQIVYTKEKNKNRIKSIGIS